MSKVVKYQIWLVFKFWKSTEIKFRVVEIRHLNRTYVKSG